MFKLNYIKISAILASLVFFMPIYIFATGSSGTTINNPLASDDITGILKNILNLVFKVGVVIVVFFIIYSGYKFVTAGSSDTDRTKAKDIFYATIIGAAILLGADVIATIVINTVKNTAGTS